jgi:GntR family transcriptional regulator
MHGYFKHSASPLYAQVADALRERIVKGTWPIGTQMPTLPELAQEFGVGLITVRQAVQVLKNEQLVAPEQGRGTFVRDKPQTHPKMRVETSLPRLADLYRKLAPRVLPLDEGMAMPRLDAEDGLPAPRYHYLRRVHASDRQRVFCDREGVVIYLGELTYRGDFIRVDMDLLG